MNGNRTKLVATLFAVMALLISNSLTYCSICAKSKEDPWVNSAQSFLSDNSTVQTPSDQVKYNRQWQAAPTGASSTNPSSYDVILDVSPQATEYIQSAISIPYAEFMNNGSRRPVSEVAKILGNAGISERDSTWYTASACPVALTPLTSTGS